MLRRIRRYDRHNWVLEEWSEAGKPIRAAFARRTGVEVSRGRWKPASYHPTLTLAGLRCLDREIGDRWNAAQDAGDPLPAIDAGAERTREIVREALALEAVPDLAAAPSA